MLDAAETLCLRQGKSVAVASTLGSVARVYRDAEFIGIGEVRADGRLYAKRLLSY
jgi:hypothetical protein